MSNKMNKKIKITKISKNCIQNCIPHFDENPHFNIPCRCGIIAPSGSGKTHFLLSYINKCQNIFGHIIIVY